jgi:potassium-transporting ATPase KdpC subunit
MSRKNIIMHFATLLLFGVLYPLLICGIGLLFPRASKGLPLEKNGKIIGFENIGQKFTEDRYFWSRPSAVGYNAASTGASNKAANNPEYLALVEKRIASFLAKNPDVQRSQIPPDLVTASGSGIDPHISPQGAIIQESRVAKARGMSIVQVDELVQMHIASPLFGPKKVNVLRLNLALDEWEKTK